VGVTPAGAEPVDRSTDRAMDRAAVRSTGGTVLPVNELAARGPVTVDLPTPGRALAVGAHPDDIEFGCGATLAKWAAAGCEVVHLVLTDGSKGSWEPGQDQASLVAARQNEQRAAAAILSGREATAVEGPEVGFLGFPDGELRNGVREQWEVCRWIRLSRPDVVVGHDPWRRYRLHPDHRHAGFVLTDALVAARDPLFFTDQDVAAHRPSALLLWEADEPNHVEDVDGFAAVKVRALLAHRSQHRTTMDVGPDGQDGADEFDRTVRRQLAEHGALAGLDCGESFRLMTDI
jgi:LmbE family N-acetylglucosaminyl deacetylase